MRTLGLLLLVLLIAGCGRVQNERFADAGAGPAESSIQIELEVTSEPTVGIPAIVTIHLDDEGKAIDGATVQIEGNMTHAGMQPVIVTAAQLVPGEYQAIIDWTMGGEWFVTARATLPDGTTAERTLNGIQVTTP